MAGIPCRLPVKNEIQKCVVCLFVEAEPKASASAYGLLFEAQWQTDKLNLSLFCLFAA